MNPKSAVIHVRCPNCEARYELGRTRELWAT